MVISPASAGGGVTITTPGISGTATTALTVSNTDSNYPDVDFGVPRKHDQQCGSRSYGSFGFEQRDREWP
jgi:hypothetical protein